MKRAELIRPLRVSVAVFRDLDAIVGNSIAGRRGQIAHTTKNNRSNAW